MEVDDFYGFDLRHVAVTPLMCIVKALDQIGQVLRRAQVRNWYGHVVGLATITHAGMPAAEQTLAREALPHQIVERCVLQVGKDGLDFRRRCAVHRRDSSKAALLLHVRYKHAVRAEGTGIAGNENAADAELGCDHSGDGRAHAAERHERKFARIVTAFDRDGAHRHHHVGDEHAQNAPGRLDCR